jgi:pyruvate/2-oxoglutarate dehydrogenase complex dihydrolipoamide acyltransferase (E2) component
VSGGVERRELTSVRKTIARRLTEAWEIPVFQLQASAEMTRVNELVARLREDGTKATVTDVLTKVCATALLRHREVNAQYAEDAILLFPTANVGIAVAAPQGLVVPVIRDCDTRGIDDLATDVERLAEAAREGRLKPEELRGSTFSVTSAGKLAGLFQTPIVNHPEVGILSIGRVAERPVVRDGEITTARVGYVCVTFDHRVVDGARAGEFGLDVIRRLESGELG